MRERLPDDEGEGAAGRAGRRKLVEAAPQAVEGTADEKDSTPADGGDGVDPEERPGPARLPRGPGRRVALRGRPADAPQRADGAPGRAREADEAGEVHERLIPVAGAAPRKEPHGRGLDRAAVAEAQEAGEDPNGVPVDGRNVEAEGDRGDGAGRIRPDSGEGAQRRDVGRKPAAVPSNDDARRGVKVPRPGVVAEAAPLGEDGRARGAGEGAHRRKPPEEPAPARGAHLDARLLEDQLGDEDPVRIAGPPKGEIAPVPRVPQEEAAGDVAAEAPGRRPGAGQLRAETR